MENKLKDLSLLLARRQKRLKYWQNWLVSKKDLDEDLGKSIKTLLSSYNKVLFEYSFCNEQEKISDYENQISSIEREIEGLFNSRRLMTSKIGIPAVGEI